MLKLEKLTKYYFSESSVVMALNNINLEFEIGEFISITGESGSGKSTLLNVLSGLDTYQEGKVYLDGNDLSHYSIDELEHYRKDYIGYIFQEYNIIENFTVYQNVELSLILQGYPKEKMEKRVLELIEQVDLMHVTHQKASNLSGGEKQRTVIARTLAKDYQILVCDEPTGNLNKEASLNIFKLLKKISQDKLVIVVTHDFSLVEDYATRKIHLYDGEIMEDSTLDNQQNNDITRLKPVTSKTTKRCAFKIAFNNTVSSLKKTTFSLLTILFILATVFFVYTARVIEINKPVQTQNPHFNNPHYSRIIVTKHNQSQFTNDELSYLEGIENVQSVFPNDLVFDSVFITKQFDSELGAFVFYEYYPLSSNSLLDYELSKGEFPENSSEVVIFDNGLFEIGDTLTIANSFQLYQTDNLETNQFEFTVVGLVENTVLQEEKINYFYLTNEGLSRLAYSSVNENSEVIIQINGTEKYDMDTNEWITEEMNQNVATGRREYMINHPIWIAQDNSLADNELQLFDMMFFDICRDFSYKKEVIDDLDAGLCDVNDFIQTHTINFRSITTFENTMPFSSITISSKPYSNDDKSPKLYMNQTTYDQYFGETKYQVSLIVNDIHEGKEIVKQLNDGEFKAFYPAKVLDEDTARDVFIHNTIVTLISAIIIAVVFLVGYFILKNVIFSKIKNYLIIRSLGTSKNTITDILRFEIILLTILALSIMGIIVIILNFCYPMLPQFLIYYRLFDVLLLVGIIILIIEFLSIKFRKEAFNTDVISALKGVEL
ncbi:MAG: ATP-binding cassette domain-containing protein [Candidatus Izimaplasma sp.]|nr:ATP-binding cassette domain-containing protein [Candidatus Izimaplasma bacterium]